MKPKYSKILVICLVLVLYFAMFLSFILGEMKEEADDIKLRNSAISIDFYVRSTYWDFIGIGFFIIATILAICAFRYFRYKKTQNLHSLDLNH